MKGHLISRSKGSWSIVIDLPRGADGRRRQKWFTVRGTKKEAEAKLASLLHELNGGGFVEPSKMTLGEYLERWLTDYADQAVKPSTAEWYRMMVRTNLAPNLGHISLARLTPLDLQRYYGQRLAEGRLSPASIRAQHRVLHKALGQAVKWGLVPRNVADAAEPPKAERHQMQTLTVEQVHALLEAARATGRYALYLMAVSTGLRQGELLALRWDDVDLDTGILSVRQTIARRGDPGQFSSPKTHRSTRPVALSPGLVAVLKEHRAAQEQEKADWGHVWKEHGLVFPSEVGTPISPRNLVRQFKCLLKRAGLPETIRFHDLRHTHATLLLKQGVHPKIVSERLGHSSITITLDTYSHVVPGLQEQAAAKIEELILDPTEPEK
ncbi:MAG TPA: site-specific integrase [Firmicutes bacterium]|nr:site-specific integrase [Bacillota bacterium]